MRILIIDQCSGAKKSSTRTEPLDRDTIDAASRASLVAQDGVESYRAEELYEGRQQQRVTEAKQLLEQAGDEVDRVFISAGFGVVDDQEELPLYDATFAAMTDSEIDKRASKLHIYEDLRDLIVDGKYEVVFFALGSDYYRSARLNELLPAVPDETVVVLFNKEELAEEHANTISIPARTAQAKAHGTIVVALKGKYLRNFAAHRDRGAEIETIHDFKTYCTENSASQTGLGDYSSNSG
jgi:hypothetical protein